MIRFLPSFIANINANRIWQVPFDCGYFLLSSPGHYLFKPIQSTSHKSLYELTESNSVSARKIYWFTITNLLHGYSRTRINSLINTLILIKIYGIVWKHVTGIYWLLFQLKKMICLFVVNDDWINDRIGISQSRYFSVYTRYGVVKGLEAMSLSEIRETLHEWRIY